MYLTKDLNWFKLHGWYNDYCAHVTKHSALKCKKKDWWARNRDNVTKWSDMSIHGLLFW